MKTNPAMIAAQQQPHPDDVLDWDEVRTSWPQPMAADEVNEPITQ